MKKLIPALAAVMVFCCLAIGQEKPWSAEYEKGVGGAVFQNVTLDQAWSSAVKTLMMDKYRVWGAEKTSGTLTAERRPAAAYNHILSLFFEQDGAIVRITASCEPLKKAEGLMAFTQQGKAMNKAHEKIQRKFFDALAAELYK